MKIDMNIITSWKFFLPMGVAIISLLWSIFNFVVGKLTASKIMNNDLKHLTDDVTELQKDKKELKIDLKQDLEKIFRRLGKIDKGLAVRTAICNERHPKDKK